MSKSLFQHAYTECIESSAANMPVAKVGGAISLLTFKRARKKIGDSAHAPGTGLGYQDSATRGKVWLVGAGPGDADLLTIKALRAIQAADMIFYDQLVSAEIRALFPAGIPALYVGKVKNHHSIAQADLNQLLVDQAKAGLTICRIKGGDPFVFGRGGEELLEMRKAGVDAEVIPGITSASGCSTYANIPLTHRGIAQGCTFVTAHAEKTLDINWRALAGLDHTLVFYMGVTRADHISTELVNAGLAATTPVAIIENGCRKDQRVLTTELVNLADTVSNHSVKSPALIIVGQVVSLAEQLQPDYWLAAAADANKLQSATLTQCLIA